MKPIKLAVAATALAVPAIAQDTREMDAHVHGVSTVEIAVEHGKVEIKIISPGMDIVGFEYEASSAEDKDAVESAIRTMLSPENIVLLPEAAECRLTEVLVQLHGGDLDHDDADAHTDDDHDEPAEAGRHSAFHVSYAFACEHELELTTITFPFFDQFESAQEIEAQYLTEAGSGQAEVGRSAPELTLE